MPNSEYFIDPMAEWRDLVGGFILAFGDIELLTFRLWREHIGETPEPHSFKERAGRVLSVLRRAGDKHAVVISSLEAALRLADKRNTVAHHPMQVQVFEHRSSGKLHFEHAISSETSDEYITDDDLKEMRAEAEDLVSQLYIQLGYVGARPRAV